MNNITTVAKDILTRASKAAAEGFAISDKLITFMWNHESEAAEPVRNAVLNAQQYAKVEADAYARVAEIEPSDLYQEIDKAAETYREEIRERHFDKLMAQTEFSKNDRLFHVIGRVTNMSSRIVTTYKNEQMEMTTAYVNYRKDEETRRLRLTFWADLARSAMEMFQVDDIIAVNGSINNRKYSGGWYTNYTARNAEIFAKADPLEYAPSPVYERSEEAAADRNYTVSIWGRRGHYRRAPKSGEIVYVRPCVCHRRKGMPVVMPEIAVEYDYE